MANEQLRQNLLAAYRRDIAGMREFIAKYQNPATSVHNMKSDFEEGWNQWEKVAEQLSQSETNEIYADEEVIDAVGEYQDVYSSVSDVYSQRMELSGGRRKRRPANRKTLRKKRTHRRRKFLNLTLRRRVRA